MIRRNLTFLLVCFALSTFSQTYFYARALVVAPNNPTAIDNISIDVFGDLSASNSVITSTAFAVNGFEIDLTLDCASPGIGSTVLVPHTETITLGNLAPGDYHINLLGTGLGDFVLDTLDYYFTVLGAQDIGSAGVPSAPAYDLFIDSDSGMIQVTQGELGDGIDIIQIIDMQGKVLQEINPEKAKVAQVTLTQEQRGILLVSVKSGDHIWSDIFTLN